MIDELEIVLNEIKENGHAHLKNDSIHWVQTSKKTEIYYNENSCRLIINTIVKRHDDNTSDAFSIGIYKNKFIYMKYYGISATTKYSCKTMEDAHIRNDITSEEEFFQEYTVVNMLDIEYDSYTKIQEIRTLISSWIWE